MPTSVSRRRLLAAVGTAVTGATAGCAAVETDPGDPAATAPPERSGTDPGPPGTVDPNVYTQVYREAIDSVVMLRVFGADGPRSQGSGFVTRDGTVVTNEHVVADATEVKVRFRRGDWREATVLGTDAYSDLAAVSVDDRPSYATPLSLIRGEPAVGQRVVALGTPYGLEGSVSAGIVSGVDRTLEAPNDFLIPDTIQTDAAVNPGNSGGPLLNLEGDVVGVISAGGGENIGFAISAQLVRRVVPELVEHGEYDHSFVGVELTDVTPTTATGNDLERPFGVMVVSVVAGGPADGVLQGATGRTTIDGATVPTGGDVIVAVDGREIPNQHVLASYLALHTAPGDVVSVTVLRDGRRRTVEIELGEREDP